MKNGSLTKNSIYSVLYSLLNSVFPFIIYMYVARILMADNLGLVAAAQNNARYFVLIISYGISAYGIKMTAQYKAGSKESSILFWELFSINGCMCLAGTFIYTAIVFFVPHFRVQALLYLITGLDIFLGILNFDWFFQGLEEYGYIALRGLVVKLITLSAVILLVRDSGDFRIYAAISVFSISGNYLLSLFRIIKKVTFPAQRPALKKHIRNIMILLGSGIAVEIYMLADTTMLDIMCDANTVGNYNLSVRSISAIRALTLAVSAVFLPKMSNLYHNGLKEDFIKLVNKGIRVVFSVSLPVATGFALVADDATVLFFGTGFMPSVMSTVILSFTVISAALSAFIGMQVLVTIDKKSITTISNICGALANIILNIFLIRTMAHVGAAIASLITGWIVCLVQMILSRKYVRISYDISKCVPASLVMTAAMLCVRLNVTDLRFRLPLCVITGAIVYLVSLYGLTKLFLRCSNLFKPGKGIYSAGFDEYRLSDNDIVKLQNSLLDLFLTFKKLCDDNNIGYMMWGGSLLGTVRHGGFIPWDDDIDIMMKREDYERFVKVLDNEQLCGNLKDLLLARPFESEGYYFKIPKLYKTNTEYMSINYMGNPKYNMIGIDIFILEKVPENRLIRKLRYIIYNIAYYASALCLDYMYPSPIIMERRLSDPQLKDFYDFRRSLGCIFSHLGGMDLYLRICDHAVRYNGKTSLRGIPSGTIREFFPDHDLEQTLEADFCGHKVRILKNYDHYLKYLYGDYMQIPPKDKQEIHVAYSLKTDTEKNEDISTTVQRSNI